MAADVNTREMMAVHPKWPDGDTREIRAAKSGCDGDRWGTPAIR